MQNEITIATKILMVSLLIPTTRKHSESGHLQHRFRKAGSFSDGIRLSLQCGTKDGRICRSRQLPYIIIVESGYSTDASSPTPGPSKQHRTVLLTLEAGGTPQRAYQHDSPRRLFCNPCAPRGDIIRRCGCVYGDNFYFARPALKAKQVDEQEPAKLRRGDYDSVSWRSTFQERISRPGTYGCQHRGRPAWVAR